MLFEKLVCAVYCTGRVLLLHATTWSHLRVVDHSDQQTDICTCGPDPDSDISVTREPLFKGRLTIVDRFFVLGVFGRSSSVYGD